jgi:hypothetical protein
MIEKDSLRIVEQGLPLAPGPRELHARLALPRGSRAPVARRPRSEAIN